MRRAATCLGGLLAGFVAGSVLPLANAAAMFTSTPVTWTAESCPAGLYTVTSTARRVGGTESYQTTSTFQLPRASVTQEFDNLPPGAYLVTATAQDATGRTFQSNAQSVINERGHREPAAMRTASAGTRGHREPVAAPAASTGTRGHRTTAPASTAHGVAAAPAQTAGARTFTAATDVASAQTVAVSHDVPRRTLEIDALLLDLMRFADLREDGTGWRRLDFIDSDDDGVIDLVRVEWTDGGVQLWRITR